MGLRKPREAMPGRGPNGFGPTGRAPGLRFPPRTGIRAGIGLGYTDNPTPVVYTPQTGSALNLIANVVVYW